MGDLRTVGVEEEFLLLRAAGPRLAPVGEAAVAGAERASDGQFEHELKREQAEIGSSPQHEIHELAADLRTLRRELAASAVGHGARLAALATSPVDDLTHNVADERYERMMELFGLVGHQQLTCGMHVHVSVESPEEGVGVLDRIRPWLPALLALSTNSPFAAGKDTGYASWRSVMWGAWPTAGVTEAFGDVAGYEKARQDLLDSGAAMDEGMIYFDARLSARYPTVEIRVADVCPRVDDAATIAALARALVTTAAREWADGRPMPAVRAELLRAATWRAGRWGMTESLVETTAARAVPAWQLIGTLLDHVQGALVAHGDLDLVRTGLAAISERGTGAVLQRAAYAAGGWAGLVDAAAETTLV